MGFTLPRLAIVSDVPVENTFHGSALIYRLLSDYPSSKLIIVESNLNISESEFRIQNVPYHVLKIGSKRLQHTRFSRYDDIAFFLRAAFTSMTALDITLDAFAPEAVLTITHGNLWLQAARYARENKIPLHLIHHDDWPSVSLLPLPLKRLLDRRFGETYRQAATRSCVSPHMEKEYKRRYRASGFVCYPSRAEAQEPDCPISIRQSERITVAFAGTVNTLGYASLLRELAVCLQTLEGSLILYGPVTPEAAATAGLDLPNVYLKGFVPSQDLHSRLRVEADVLFVPMSFAGSDRTNMQMGFPSKLADYTAVGLPLLICGPEYCSAVVWARENPGVAELAITVDQLPISLRRLASADHRVCLAAHCIDVGMRYFSHKTAWTRFVSNFRELAPVV